VADGQVYRAIAARRRNTVARAAPLGPGTESVGFPV